MADDQPATPATEKSPAVKVNTPVANPEFISWKYPPYCELCHVHFNYEPNAKLHFDGRNHCNRLHTWRKYQSPGQAPASTQKTVLCDICWKEMNTQLIMDQHLQSPAHKKEESGRLVVQKLKEDYRQLKEGKPNEV